jgi:hypothetical protein
MEATAMKTSAAAECIPVAGAQIASGALTPELASWSVREWFRRRSNS